MYSVTNDMGLVYLLLVSLLILLCCTYDSYVYVEIEGVQCAVMKALIVMLFTVNSVLMLLRDSSGSSLVWVNCSYILQLKTLLLQLQK
jgi:hypothetical protein